MYCGFPTDIRIQADCATVLQQVLDAVEARADNYRQRVAARARELARYP